MRKKIKITSSGSSNGKLDIDGPTRRRLPDTPDIVVLRQKPGRSKLSNQDFGHLSPIRTGCSRPPSVEYAGKVLFNQLKKFCCVLFS